MQYLNIKTASTGFHVIGLGHAHKISGGFKHVYPTLPNLGQWGDIKAKFKTSTA